MRDIIYIIHKFQEAELKCCEIKWVRGPGYAEDQSPEKTSLRGDISPTWKGNLELIHLTRESGTFQEEEISIQRKRGAIWYFKSGKKCGRKNKWGQIISDHMSSPKNARLCPGVTGNRRGVWIRGLPWSYMSLRKIAGRWTGWAECESRGTNQNAVKITQARADKELIWAMVQGRIKKEDKYEI